MKISAHEIANKLRKLRRWKQTSWWLLAGFFVVGSAAMAILPERFWKIVIVGYWVLMMGNAFRVGFASCPVCGKAFHGRTTRSGIPYRNNLTSSCLNCGVLLTASDFEIEQAIKQQETEHAGASDGDKPLC